jgi:methyl-accepting chemotaxis protein
MKIHNKLIATFSLILLFVVGVGWVAYQGMTQIEKNLNDIFSISLPSIDKLIEADRDMQQMLVAERSMIAADPQAPIFATLQKEYDNNLNQVYERFAIYKGLVDSP